MKLKSTSASTVPASAGAPFTLSTFLPYRLNVLATVVSEGLARTYTTRFGIGIPEWRVLATVGEFGSITAKAIGLHAHMNKVKVSRAVATLETRGLIRRCPNKNDLREAFLVLTTSGERVYGKILPRALDYQATLLAGLTSHETTILNLLVDKLLSAAQANRGGSPGRIGSP